MEKIGSMKDRVPYFCFLDDEESIIYNKNDTIQMTLKITYRNLDFESEDIQEYIFEKLNHAVKSLDVENYFTLYFETQRKKTTITEILREDIPIPTHRIFTEQQEKINNRYNCYVTENYITINFSIDRFHSIQKLMKKLKITRNNENLEKKMQQDFSKHINFFKEKIHEFISQIDPVILDGEILKGEELQAFLLSQVTGDFFKRIKISDNNSLDEYFSLSEFENRGRYSKINDEYIACIAFVSFPDLIRTRILKELESLKFPFRYVARFAVEKQSRLQFRFKNTREYHKISTHSMGEYATKSFSGYEDETSRDLANEVQEAIKELRKKQSIFGQMTATVIVKDKNYSNLEDKINAVLKITRFNGFWCKNDTYNMYSSYFGAVAGNNGMNKRTGLTPSTSLLCMVSMSTPFLGFQYNEHLKEHSLVNGLTENNDLYHFNLHVSDVGHTLIVGPAGSGKSVLLGLIASQFMRYKNAKIIFFDKNQSSKVLCRCSGGEFYNIGNDDFSFQIMENVNIEKYKNFVREWLLSIAELEKEELSIDEKNLITETLNHVAQLPKNERTFTSFESLLANNRLKRIFDNYINGSYKRYFNRNREVAGSNFIVYEMDAILKDKKLVNFILNYLFFNIEQQVLTGEPTLIIVDEAWTALNNEFMKKQLEEWLRELRKKNASVIFATQSLSEVNSSSIAPVIMENCKTKVMLPNEGAERNRELYRYMGLSDEEIEKVRNALPKREYFIKNDIGSALVTFDLGKETIDYIGASRIEDINTIDEICSKEKDLRKINEMWLDYKSK